MRQLLITYTRTLHVLRQQTRLGLLAAATLVLFVQAITAANATGFLNDYVIVNGQRGGSAFGPVTYTTNGTGAPSFQQQSLGTFNIGTANPDVLYLNTRVSTNATNGDLVQTPQLLYRIYRNDRLDDLGNFISINIPLESGNAGSDATWANLSNQANILGSINSPGTYTVQLYFQATVANGSTATSTISDSNNGQLYAATFNVNVNGSNIQPISWNTTSNDGNWFNAANWSPSVVPNSNTDVTIPVVSGGRYPVIDGTLPAQVRNVLIARRNQIAAQLNLNSGAQLYIYGNFQDTGNGFKQNGGSVTLTGTNQTFDASSSLILYDLRITGGGVKTLTNSLTIANTLTFVPNANGTPAGTLNTRTDYSDASNPSPDNNYYITLSDGAQIFGETEGAYILGLVRAVRDVVRGEQNKFGNIGADLTINSAGTIVTRVTASRLNYIFFGAGTSQSVRRSYAFQPATSTVTDFSLAFHYTNDDLNGINPNDLLLFRSENGDIPFDQLFKTTLNTTTRVLTRVNITQSLSALFTLGDANNPLPVELASFTATPAAKGAAQLKWVTASETNNKGFGIERQLEGSVEWVSLGYVAGANLAAGSSYSYLDQTLANASASATKAYYRLRQEDQDGSLHYSPVAVVSRTATSASTALALYPVPVSGDQLTVAFAEANQPGLEVVVTNMQGQRVLRYVTTANTDAAVQLPVQQLAAGVYVVSVQVPGQAKKHARFVKQ